MSSPQGAGQQAGQDKETKNRQANCAKEAGKLEEEVLPLFCCWLESGSEKGQPRSQLLGREPQLVSGMLWCPQGCQHWEQPVYGGASPFLVSQRKGSPCRTPLGRPAMPWEGLRAGAGQESGDKRQKRLERGERCPQVACSFSLPWPLSARRSTAWTLAIRVQSFTQKSCRTAASPHPPAAPHAGGAAPSPGRRAGTVVGAGGVVSTGAGGRWAGRAAAGWGALVQARVAAAGAGPVSVPGLPRLRRGACGERRLGSTRRPRRSTSAAVLQGQRQPADGELGRETAAHCCLLLRSRMTPQHRSVPKSREPTIAAALTRQCLRTAAPAEALALLSPAAPGGTALGLSASSRCWAACGSSGSAETVALPLPASPGRSCLACSRRRRRHARGSRLRAAQYLDSLEKTGTPRCGGLLRAPRALPRRRERESLSTA